jgi:hypothetical protein
VSGAPQAASDSTGWVWRTGAGRSVHRRDPVAPATARCGDRIVGRAAPRYRHLPGYRCTGCSRARQHS